MEEYDQYRNVNNLAYYFYEHTPSEKLIAYKQKRASDSSPENKLSSSIIKKDMFEFLAEYKDALHKRIKDFDQIEMGKLMQELDSLQTEPGGMYQPSQFVEDDYCIAVLEEIDKYCTYMQKELEEAFNPHFNPQDIEFSLLDYFENWLIIYSEAPKYQVKRREAQFFKQYTYLSEKESIKITNRLKLYYLNYSGEIPNDLELQLNDEEILKAYEYNLTARFKKWKEAAKSHFVTEKQFLDFEVARWQMLTKKSSQDDSNINYYDSVKRAADLAYANVNLNIVKARLMEYEKLQGLPNSNDQDSATKAFIRDQFQGLGKECFRSPKDFSKFLDLLTNFFEDKPYVIPKEPIKLIKGRKTRIAAIFAPIHRELIMTEQSLRADTKYFDILKCLDVFHSLTYAQVYSTLGK